MRNAMSKHATTSQPNLVSDIEQDILSNLNVTFFDDERTVDDEIREEVAKAEAKAARTAQSVREKHKAKVTSLCDRIAQVKRELKVSIRSNVERIFVCVELTLCMFEFLGCKEVTEVCGRHERQAGGHDDFPE